MHDHEMSVPSVERSFCFFLFTIITIDEYLQIVKYVQLADFLNTGIFIHKYVV